MQKIKICDGGGYENLNKIWKSENILFKNLKKRILLLYDCDTKIQDNQRNNIVKRIIPPYREALFERGIENLFSKETILKIMDANPQFIDKIEQTKKIERGIEKIIPEKYSINENEKGNLCEWICENGTKEHFANFEIIVKMIDEFLQST